MSLDQSDKLIIMAALGVTSLPDEYKSRNMTLHRAHDRMSPEEQERFDTYLDMVAALTDEIDELKGIVDTQAAEIGEQSGFAEEAETLENQLKDLIRLILDRGDVRQTVQLKDLARSLAIYS